MFCTIGAEATLAIRTLAFSVQLGTEGLAIAQTVAARLGYHYIDWNDTSRAAIASGIAPDVVAEFERNRPRLLGIVEKLLTSASMLNDEVTSDATVNPAVMSWAMNSLDRAGYRGFIEDMVRELNAQGGAVIVGHAAQVILREDDNAFKVLVCGEEPRRAERLALESGQSLESALRSVRKSDRERREFYKRVYGVDAFAPEVYDLTIRSDRLARDAAIESILAAVNAIGVDRVTPADTAADAAPITTAPIEREREVPPTSEQDALRRARLRLEAALASPPGEAFDADSVRTALRELQSVFGLHVSESEGPDGTLADALQRKPYLQQRVGRLRDDHIRIVKELTDLMREMDHAFSPEFDANEARERATRALVALRLHEASGFDLLYEAYVRDEGGE
jgi:hypothetical protein